MWYCDSSGDKEDSDDGHKGRTLWYQRCLPSWHSSKTTCWRSNRSSDEEGDNEDDADGREDDVGNVEADSHHSLLSSCRQGFLGLGNVKCQVLLGVEYVVIAISIIFAIPDIIVEMYFHEMMITSMAKIIIKITKLTEVRCAAGSSKTNLAIPSSPFSALSLRQSLLMIVSMILILLLMLLMMQAWLRMNINFIQLTKGNNN